MDGLRELDPEHLLYRRTIPASGESDPLLIPHDRGALKLLQRIRDEAHRFANGYNALLYRRRMKESLLDDCPAVSPKKKQALLQKFGSVDRIRTANVKGSDCPTVIGAGPDFVTSSTGGTNVNSLSRSAVFPAPPSSVMNSVTGLPSSSRKVIDNV